MTITGARQRIMRALFSIQGLFTAAIIATFILSPILAAVPPGYPIRLARPGKRW